MLQAVQRLDDYWFFQNVLINENLLVLQSPSLPTWHSSKEVVSRSQSTDQERDTSNVLLLAVASPPSMHRVPTLPPPLRRQQTADEVAADNSCYLKLQHSLSSLDGYKSCSSKRTPYSEEPSRYIKLKRSERYVAIQHYIAREAYYRKILKEKKWRSLSDLECIEVQGFKDLGFVFDHREGPNIANLVKIIPGLRQLESPGPPPRRYVDKRSTEDMKEQLVFWARAVASNARQEL